MIDLPSFSEALAAWVAGTIARAWRRADAPQVADTDEELDDD